MKIVVLGGGPAGLYFALLAKKADPSHNITVLERNPAGVTYGWGVVFSDRTLASFQRADYRTYERITSSFVIWDAIDVHYRGETIRCNGHVIASISRKALLGILQERCAELGVEVRYGVDVTDLGALPECDLLVAADGVNSVARRAYEHLFRPHVEPGKAKYIWLGAEKVLDAFNFIFHENEHGLFQVHAYPFSGTTSTFIVECDEQSWLNAGLDRASEAESLDFCRTLLADDLRGAPLMSNNSKWINFPTLKVERWSLRPGEYERPGGGSAKTGKARGAPKLKLENYVVLMGDAVHTAHFSIGSGTKLAMEDAISLAAALERHGVDLRAATNEYELERKPVSETFQRAAAESRRYFETIKRYTVLPPEQFAFQLLTRSGRITYDDLRLRDGRYIESVDRWYRANAAGQPGAGGSPLLDGAPPVVAPPPLFAPIVLRSLRLENRVAMAPEATCAAEDGTPTAEQGRALSGAAGAGLVMAGACAVSAEGRITPGTPGLYASAHEKAWRRIVEQARADSGAKMGVTLLHAGRRGSTRERSAGLDRPLREGGWPLLAPSPVPYMPAGLPPREMGREDMARVIGEFAATARMAARAGFDLLQVHMAHGYLLASFLSPLSNNRGDDYGGDLASRVRFPLEVFEAVRAAWPAARPISAAILADDCARGGWEVEDAVYLAKALKERGCDLIEVLAGGSVPEAEPVYGRGFLTAYSDRVRNSAGVPTMVGGYLTTADQVNTALAAGRADICILSR